MNSRFTKILLVTVVVAGVFVSTAAALRFSDKSYFVPAGEVGTPYSHRFEGVNGSPPFDFHVIRGSLPPGLTLDSGGQVSGTPTESGVWSFWVELADTWCPSHPSTPCAQREFSIAIAPDLRITTESAPAATLATPYALQVGWTGGGNITWAISAGALPPGMTLDQTGLIQGTPTTAGSFTFTLLIKHEFRSDTKNLTLSVRERLAFTVPTDVPAAEVGVPLTPLGLAASGGSEKYTWEIDPATLPAGVAVDAEGKIVGTPRVAGTFPIVVVVKDDEGRSATGQLVITIAPKLAVATRRLPQTKVGKTFKALLRTSGGIAPVRWKAVRGEGRFPPGVRLNKKTGLLVGKPRKPGVYRFMVQATDGFKVTATRKLAIVVKAPPKSKKKQKKTR